MIYVFMRCEVFILRSGCGFESFFEVEEIELNILWLLNEEWS